MVKIEIDGEDICPCYCFNNRDGNYECVWEADEFIALLLLEGILFTNSFYWEKGWPKEAQNKTSLHINCNDTFAWGCADAEDIDYSEFDTLYAYYMKDKQMGTTIWCIKKRGYMPQKPVYAVIQKEGIWDLDKMNLKPNLFEIMPDR